MPSSCRTPFPSLLAPAAAVLVCRDRMRRYKPVLRACVSASSCVSRSEIEARCCAAKLPPWPLALPLAAPPSCVQELNALWAARQCRLLHEKPSPDRDIWRVASPLAKPLLLHHSPAPRFSLPKLRQSHACNGSCWPDVCGPQPGLATAAASSHGLHKLFTHSPAGGSHNSLVVNQAIVLGARLGVADAGTSRAGTGRVLRDNTPAACHPAPVPPRRLSGASAGGHHQSQETA